MSAADGFLRSCERFGSRPALVVAGATLTYAELAERALSIAATLDALTPDGGPPLTAAFGYRTPTAFAGMLGALLRGHGYVPLNRRFPIDRTRTMLVQAGCRAIVADAESAEQLDELLNGIEHDMLVVLPDVDDARALAAAWPQHRFVAGDGLLHGGDFTPAAARPDDLAYLLFTSGSTGVPKGVMVAHRNLAALLEFAVGRFDVHEHDRLSQSGEPTFDLSVFEIFLAWERGACLCCPSAKTLLQPSRFIRDSRLTLWFSVPSTAILMRGLGVLKPASFPDLRWTLLGGEALPLDVARDWRRAAPNAELHNLYGPTELTVACTAYTWDDERSPGECSRGLVPIGTPTPLMTPLLVDRDLREVAVGAEGELLMTGPQLTPGYWRDTARTASAYVVPPGRDETFYRTGDLVRRDPDGTLHFRGRVDDQVEVLGHRVELGEVEAAVREASGVDAVVAIGWPVTPTGAGGIVAFVGRNGIDPERVRARVAARIPGFMVPRRIEVVDELPVAVGGKYDRGALARRLEMTT